MEQNQETNPTNTPTPYDGASPPDATISHNGAVPPDTPILHVEAVPPDTPVPHNGEVDQVNSQSASIIKEKLMNWFAFNIFIAILPIIAHLAKLFNEGQNISFFDLFSHGELLLISVAITADAIGELVLKGKTKGRYAAYFYLGVMFAFGSGTWFATLGIDGAASQVERSFAILSIALFFGSVFAANCKFLAEV
jgi:hypothetical protein